MSCGRYYKTVAEWHHGSGGDVPSNALHAGFDIDGATIYVGRAEHDGDTIPGKIVPGHGCCYVSHGGEEHKKHSYQVLCNPSCCNLEWLPASNGDIPPGALQGGTTCDGEPLYIGRTQHEGSLTIGKVHRAHGCLYIPFGGGEHSYTEYEVLTCQHIPLD